MSAAASFAETPAGRPILREETEAAGTGILWTRIFEGEVFLEGGDGDDDERGRGEEPDGEEAARGVAGGAAERETREGERDWLTGRNACPTNNRRGRLCHAVRTSSPLTLTLSP
jgi:hypothetical protein